MFFVFFQQFDTNISNNSAFYQQKTTHENKMKKYKPNLINKKVPTMTT